METKEKWDFGGKRRASAYSDGSWMLEVSWPMMDCGLLLTS